MIKIKRERYIIIQKYGEQTLVMCGLARNYHFKPVDGLGDAAIKTYMSATKARAAFIRSWGARLLGTIEIVKVLETMTQVKEEEMK